MAQLIINTPTDGDAVWLWELCKKLGYGVEAVHFGNSPVTGCNSSDLIFEEGEMFVNGAVREAILYARNRSKNHHSRKESSRIIKKVTKP